MRRTITFVALCIFVIPLISAKSLTLEETMLRRVIEVDKKSNELFSLSMDWIAKTFTSAKSVIEYQDKEVGKIVGKGMIRIKYTPLAAVDTFFTITIEVKDGKARITVENPIMEASISGIKMRDPITNKAQMKKYQVEIEKMFDSYESALHEEKEDW